MAPWQPALLACAVGLGAACSQSANSPGHVRVEFRPTGIAGSLSPVKADLAFDIADRLNACVAQRATPSPWDCIIRLASSNWKTPDACRQAPLKNSVITTYPACSLESEIQLPDDAEARGIVRLKAAQLLCNLELVGVQPLDATDRSPVCGELVPEESPAAAACETCKRATWIEYRREHAWGQPRVDKDRIMAAQHEFISSCQACSNTSSTCDACSAGLSWRASWARENISTEEASAWKARCLECAEEKRKPPARPVCVQRWNDRYDACVRALHEQRFPVTMVVDLIYAN